MTDTKWKNRPPPPRHPRRPPRPAHPHQSRALAPASGGRRCANAERARQKERDEQSAPIWAAMQLDAFAKAFGGSAPLHHLSSILFPALTPGARSPRPRFAAADDGHFRQALNHENYQTNPFRASSHSQHNALLIKHLDQTHTSAGTGVGSPIEPISKPKTASHFG